MAIELVDFPMNDGDLNHSDVELPGDTWYTWDIWSKIVSLGDVNGDVMWVKQCHKPPIWEWLIPPIYSDLGFG